SVGLIDGEPYLDLSYAEDVTASVDFNVVMTANGQFIEVQGTAEMGSFDRPTLDRLLDVASQGIQELIEIQQHVLAASHE
ncbi:MAG: ribonuclease PH, partial [Thermosynechococcus sp.]